MSTDETQHRCLNLLDHGVHTLEAQCNGSRTKKNYYILPLLLQSFQVEKNLLAHSNDISYSHLHIQTDENRGALILHKLKRLQKLKPRLTKRFCSLWTVTAFFFRWLKHAVNTMFKSSLIEKGPLTTIEMQLCRRLSSFKQSRPCRFSTLEILFPARFNTRSSLRCDTFSILQIWMKAQ